MLLFNCLSVFFCRFSRRFNFVVGSFVFNQAIDSNPVIKQEQGSAAARVLLAPSANAATPGLLDRITGRGATATATPASISCSTSPP